MTSPILCSCIPTHTSMTSLQQHTTWGIRIDEVLKKEVWSWRHFITITSNNNEWRNNMWITSQTSWRHRHDQYLSSLNVMLRVHYWMSIVLMNTSQNPQLYTSPSTAEFSPGPALASFRVGSREKRNTQTSDRYTKSGWIKKCRTCCEYKPLQNTIRFWKIAAFYKGQANFRDDKYSPPPLLTSAGCTHSPINSRLQLALFTR